MKPAAPVTSQVVGALLPDTPSSGSCRRRMDEDKGLDPTPPVDRRRSQLDDPSPMSPQVGGHRRSHIASVDDEPSLLDDPIPVIRTVIGRDDNTIGFAQR